MEESEKEAIREASKEASHEFKTLVNTQDLDSLKQLQLIMYILSTSIFLNPVLLRDCMILCSEIAI